MLHQCQQNFAKFTSVDVFFDISAPIDVKITSISTLDFRGKMSEKEQKLYAVKIKTGE